MNNAKYGFISEWDIDDKYSYWCYWDELTEAKEKENIEHGDDVRSAGYVLDQLGVPNTEVYAYEEDDDKGWRIAWK